MKQLPIIAGYPPERIHKFILRHGVTQSQGFVASIVLQNVNATACTILVKDYLEQHLCVSFACPNSMNLNSPFIWTTIKFQITCCAIVSGNPFSKFIKGISC